jgi:large subunit ribosomal protein L25
MEPIKTTLLHADFYEVALDRAITVKVHVELTGTAVGVKTQGGKLEFVTREIEVECLPTDIPEKLVVDVTALELGKHIRVHDLQVPKGVTFLTGPEVVVVHVVTIRGEEEAAPAAEVAVAAPAEPEVIKKGKVEGEAETGEKAEKKPEKGEKRPEKKEKK